MLKLFFTSIFILSTFFALCQEKVAWTGSYNSDDSTIVIHADIADGWHLYSQNLENDMGPIPTEFTYEKNDKIQFSKLTQEPKPKESFDENFGANMSYFIEDVDFKNKVVVSAPTNVTITVLFMICNDEMCLPPSEKQINIKIK